ncbi:lysosomal alpha-mannosidase [Clonorchis sinensis]|uniref:Alpha-mannosidase n=1 Tax=Clonorchis sinensis TaxID=79923 RepID=G7YAW6_CLOSI|nr:lysosomal alpha-mannosidase [Clonorchis sinensis]
MTRDFRSCVILPLLIIGLSIATKDGGKDYQPGCNPGLPDALNIHIIAHSHDDVGWVRTPEEYYNESVDDILSNVISELIGNSEYRFTYVEMAYFHMWWAKQSAEFRKSVHQLVCAGRLQFANGGWTMSDEATVYYGDDIDQLTRGRYLLRQLFGKCGLPRTAWQIDTFGHARDRADLMAQAGYDSLIFQRAHFQEKFERARNRTLQFLWDTREHIGTRARQLFTHIFSGTYCYPKDFNFDERGIFISEGANEVAVFTKILEEIEEAYETNHLLLPMGCDFSYRQAKITFRNVDSLIQLLNGLSLGPYKQMNLFYSTPACYTLAVNREFEKLGELTRRFDDFFPYADRASNYWVGFYTSRPAFKAYVRQGSALLTAVEQLNVLLLGNAKSTPIDYLRRELSILQHHDAITGTEKQYVANDYVRRLHDASQTCQNIFSEALGHLSGGIQLAVFCNYLNLSVCPETVVADSQYSFTVTIYNPLGWSLDDLLWVRIPVHVPESGIRFEIVNVENPTQFSFNYQLLPVSDRTWLIPEREPLDGKANMELIFSPVQDGHRLTALGFTTFNVTASRPMKENPRHTFGEKIFGRKPSLMQFSLDHNGRNIILWVKHVTSEKQFKVLIEMMYYDGETEYNPSGAYVFTPTSRTEAFHFGMPFVTVTRGCCVHEITARYASWATLVVRHFSDQKVEVEWTVGPISDKGNTVSREVIVRYTVEGVPEILPNTPGEFFTDSAGRRLIRRIRKMEYDTVTNETDPIAANYYPVINRILLKGRKQPFVQGLKSYDRTREQKKDLPALAFAVYTDRAQGGTSLKDGQVELMVHRRLIRDDNLGVDENLMENGIDGDGLIVRGQHWIHLDLQSVVLSRDREFATRVTKAPIIFFNKRRISAPIDPHALSWSGLNGSLPSHIHLLNLVAWPLTETENGKKQRLLIRLENFQKAYTKGPPIRHRPYLLRLSWLFSRIQMHNCTEVNLTADQTINSPFAQQLHWPGGDLNDQATGPSSNVIQVRLDEVNLLLHPETIHTFLCTFQRI